MSKLSRPKFLAIISSATLGTMLARRSDGRVDGFVVEGSTAGGHNAPPRGPLQLNTAGEPIYGERDVADLQAIRSIGLPFWLAGGYATPGDFALARQAGAVGVQIGTAFAFCDESDLAPDLKTRVLQASLAQEARVLTDPLASPTGFPFKVLQLAGTLSEQDLLRGPPAPLRSGLPASSLSHTSKGRWVAMRCRTRGRFCRQGWRGRGNTGP